MPFFIFIEFYKNYRCIIIQIPRPHKKKPKKNHSAVFSSMMRFLSFFFFFLHVSNQRSYIDELSNRPIHFILYIVSIRLRFNSKL